MNQPDPANLNEPFGDSEQLPPAAAQPVAWMVGHGANRYFTDAATTDDQFLEVLNLAGRQVTPLYTAPPSAPVGVEAVDAAAWNEALELPEGFRVAEHLPGVWEYQFDIEDEADEDSDRKVSGASWNHPALAAIAAWGHAYDTLAQPPAAVDEAMVERAARAWCAGTDTPFDQLPDAGKARCLEDMRVVLTAALAAQDDVQ